MRDSPLRCSPTLSMRSHGNNGVSALSARNVIAELLRHEPLYRFR